MLKLFLAVVSLSFSVLAVNYVDNNTVLGEYNVLANGRVIFGDL